MYQWFWKHPPLPHFYALLNTSQPQQHDSIFAFLQYLRSDDPELHAELVTDDRMEDDERGVRNVGSDRDVRREDLGRYVNRWVLLS